MIFCAKNKKIPNYTALTLNNISIHRSHQENYLGLHLDDKLDWRAHIDHVKSKVSSITGALRRAVGCIPREVRMTIYNSLVKSHLEYLIEIWGCAAETNLKPLQTAQNKLVKILFNYDFFTNTLVLYKETKIFNIKQLYTYATCNLINKNMCGNQHSCLKFTIQTYKHTMRYKNKIQTRKPRTTCYGIKNIMYEGVQLFNNLPNCIKTCTTVKEFKKNLKLYVYSLLN